jgi:hypothetical protein
MARLILLCSVDASFIVDAPATPHAMGLAANKMQLI